MASLLLGWTYERQDRALAGLKHQSVCRCLLAKRSKAKKAKKAKKPTGNRHSTSRPRDDDDGTMGGCIVYVLVQQVELTRERSRAGATD